MFVHLKFLVLGQNSMEVPWKHLLSSTCEQVLLLIETQPTGWFTKNYLFQHLAINAYKEIVIGRGLFFAHLKLLAELGCTPKFTRKNVRGKRMCLRDGVVTDK